MRQRQPQVERAHVLAEERAVLVPVGVRVDRHAPQRALVGRQRRPLAEVLDERRRARSRRASRAARTACGASRPSRRRRWPAPTCAGRPRGRRRRPRPARRAVPGAVVGRGPLLALASKPASAGRSRRPGPRPVAVGSARDEHAPAVARPARRASGSRSAGSTRAAGRWGPASAVTAARVGVDGGRGLAKRFVAQPDELELRRRHRACVRLASVSRRMASAGGLARRPAGARRRRTSAATGLVRSAVTLSVASRRHRSLQTPGVAGDRTVARRQRSAEPADLPDLSVRRAEEAGMTAGVGRASSVAAVGWGSRSASPSADAGRRRRALRHQRRRRRPGPGRQDAVPRERRRRGPRPGARRRPPHAEHRPGRRWRRPSTSSSWSARRSTSTSTPIPKSRAPGDRAACSTTCTTASTSCCAAPSTPASPPWSSGCSRKPAGPSTCRSAPSASPRARPWRSCARCPRSCRAARREAVERAPSCSATSPTRSSRSRSRRPSWPSSSPTRGATSSSPPPTSSS